MVTVSCSDELGGERTPISSESNLHVLVPTVLSSRGTNPDDASGLHTYNATVDECQINDLTLYAFPTENEGKLLKKTLPAPLATMMADEGIATYQLNITPGKYHIYVVANMNKVLSSQTIQTEDALKNIVLDYRPTSRTGMPVCTNIPMIYEPEKDAVGKLAVTEIKAAGDKYTEVAANLKFTCVKVKLNLIFDPNDAEVATNFGGKAFSINSISADKLSPFTHLYWGGKFEAPSWADKDYKDGFSSNTYQTSEGPAVYYTEWTDNRSASATNNNDDIKGTGDAKNAPDNAAEKWLFQQTYYLPERYISSESDRSYLTINGKVGNSAVNNYRINLGHKKDETSTTEVPVFPRGTFYEITGAIKTLGNMELDCKVSVKPWETVPIDADFNHTTLWVSKTEANVTSMKNDYITYNSNAGTVGFGCDTKINSKDIIIGTKRGKDANGNDSIEFRVNPNIPIKAYAQLVGTAKFWLKANNLKKYIDVHYDVKPYLDVTKELVIYYNKDDKSQNKRTIKWDTNLGGIKLDRTTDKKGSSIIKMSVNSSDDATGTFTVTATENPVTTTIHEFTVTSKDGSMPQKVRVKVSPPIGDYRIYFRAINDRSKYNGGNGSDNFQGILTEEGTNNWSDGWNEDAKDTSDPITKSHYIYVYTQIGETEDAVTGKGWVFTKESDDRNGWPGVEMVADETNTGWYYKNFPVDAKSVLNTNESKGQRTITPGETLIMFSNNTYLDQGYSLHRCPHHLEPGIPLFDYEDREGWIVYDPTSDPIWCVHDDMPEIENIEFKVYTQFALFGWYKVYGIASGENQFTIWDTKAKKSWKCEKVGKDWYKTTIKLKAVKGEHEKNILLKKEDNDKSPTITLFDGNSYEKYGDTGYYQGDKWHQGKPNGVTE
ncbi:fimbrial protein [Segatella sp.]|uniref:fimbrial protein n=1 Tax=Segatella sp. TaxID=2974253 RepID=UPI003AB973BE